MTKFDALFSDSDREAVNRAVQEAEALTSAEIIPVIAASSGRYDRSEDIVGLWLAVAALCVVWAVYPTGNEPDNSWGAPAAIWQLVTFAAAIVLGFVLGALIASRVDVLRRLFTPQQQMRDEVALRARAVFFDQRVHHTTGASGVLLYVSLFEHMATVIADQSVLDKLGQTQIDAICAAFTQQLHQGKPATALCATARLVGERLSGVLPRKENDQNELPDALIVMA